MASLKLRKKRSTVSPTLLFVLLVAILIAGCGGGASSSSGSTSTTTPASSAPTAQLTASPASISRGQSSTLTWSTTNATTVSIDQGIGSVAASSSTTVSPLTTTTYTLTASGMGGNATASATVTVTAPAGMAAIKHIIFMLQENRSFDSYFGQMGAYRSARGFNDAFDGLPSNVSLKDLAGHAVSPYHFTTVCHDNLSPAWNESHFDVDKGKMDNFMKTANSVPSTNDPDGTRAMGYYDSTDLPYYYELAFQYATSDRFFSSVLTDTLPNRMYMFTGTSFGHIRPQDVPPPGGWTQPTIFDALRAAKVSWRYYFQDNSVFLSDFSTFPTLQGSVFGINQFFQDIQSDPTLAQVVFIERAGRIGLDEHPSNNIQKGAADVANIINAWMNSPTYQDSVFILAYDEGGGMYDHVPPVKLAVPDNIPPMLRPGDLPGAFDTSGFRVPLIVISPFTKPHFVSHTPRDFGSILKFIEQRYGVPSLTQRDAQADDMTEFFNFAAPQIPAPPPLPVQPIDGLCDPAQGKAPGH
jgi:phospholipase C